MLEWLAFPVGAVLGFLAGLGVGGGSILMVWLTTVMQMPQTDARVINLMFFLPAALISTFCRRKTDTLDFKKILPAIICACAASALLTIVSKEIDTTLLKKLFGVILIATGLKELFYRAR